MSPNQSSAIGSIAVLARRSQMAWTVIAASPVTLLAQALLGISHVAKCPCDMVVTR